MAGAGFAFEAVAQAFDDDGSAEILRVDLFGRRHKEIANTKPFERVAIGIEGARIFIEILGRAELLGIHENGDGHGRALALRFADEGDVAFVKRAHGRDESEDVFFQERFVGDLFIQLTV